MNGKSFPKLADRGASWAQTKGQPPESRRGPAGLSERHWLRARSGPGEPGAGSLRSLAEPQRKAPVVQNACPRRRGRARLSPPFPKVSLPGGRRIKRSSLPSVLQLSGSSTAISSRDLTEPPVCWEPE